MLANALKINSRVMIPRLLYLFSSKPELVNFDAGVVSSEHDYIGESDRVAREFWGEEAYDEFKTNVLSYQLPSDMGEQANSLIKTAQDYLRKRI